MRTILNKNWCIDHFRSPRTFHKGFFIAFKEKAIEDSNLNETSRGFNFRKCCCPGIFLVKLVDFLCMFLHCFYFIPEDKTEADNRK